jgi:hypothetical protein
MGLLNSNTLNDYVTKTIPKNARNLWGEIKQSPQAVSELFTGTRARDAYNNASAANIDKDAAMVMAIDFLQTTIPGGGLLGMVKKVKPPKVLYRGTGKDGSTYGTYMLGKGLYSSPDKSFAAKYGDKIETLSPEDAFPKNPLVIERSAGGAPSVFMDWALEKSGLKNAREFNKKYPDPGEFVKSLGYDGVVIGDEIVKY